MSTLNMDSMKVHNMTAGTLTVRKDAHIKGNLIVDGTVERSLLIPAPDKKEFRRQEAYDKRVKSAYDQYKRGVVEDVDNGDTARYLPLHFANFTKGMPHDNNGFVDDAAWQALLHACETEDPADFEAIPLGYYGSGHKKFTNPQAGLAFDTEGSDPWAQTLPPFPRFDSAQLAGEAVELYWAALCRDVNFDQFGSDSTALASITDLNALSDFRGPKVSNLVTPDTLFRTNIPGVLDGPFVSQFLYMNCPFGASSIDQKINAPTSNLDYMTTHQDWLDVQNAKPNASMTFNPTKRYIINPRDLAQFAHIDVLYQAYQYALLILFATGAPPSPTNPYVNSVNQDCFATLCGPFSAAHMPEMATRALEGVWHQKWFVHRALRPEVYGQRVNAKKTNAYNFPVHNDVLNSNALTQIFSKFSSYLLPMAWPEGSPLHPTYGSGHATVAGACVTFLKMVFDDTHVLSNCVQPNSDGSALVPYTDTSLTVGGELNKLAWNVAIGRNFGGVHWRTDQEQSLRLGEQICLSVLRDIKPTLNENFTGWTCTGFDGETLTV